MKTLQAPDTAAAWMEAARDMAAANPAPAFFLLVIATAFFAAYAAKGL